MLACYPRPYFVPSLDSLVLSRVVDVIVEYKEVTLEKKINILNKVLDKDRCE